MSQGVSAEVDVLIAGAGPVGMALAAEMARHGVRPRIVDKTGGTKTISKALILHVRTQEVFDAMGIVGEAKARSVPMTNVQIHAYGRRIGQWDFTGVIDSPHPHPIILGQDRTEKILEEHLGSLGVAVEWNTEAIAYSQDDDGVSVRLRDLDGREAQVRAKYLVGCEGAHSMTRKTSGLEFPGDAYTGEQFIQSDCKIRWELPRGSNYLFLTDVGYLMVIEMPDEIVRIFISLPDPDPSINDSPTLEDIRSNLARLTGFDVQLTDPVWLARYRTSHRRAPSFRKGRAFLAGDAGHIHVPIGGQGMNTGLQDAFNLGWKLAAVIKGEARPSLLDTYDAERVPVADRLLSGTDRAYRFVLHPGDMMKHAVRTFGPFVISTGTAQETFVKTLEEVNINYRNGPLSEDHGGSHGPAAGDRALDGVAVRLTDKATVRLFDVIRDVRWSVLLFAGPDPTDGTLERFGALARTVHSRFVRSVGVHLVVSHGPLPDDTSDHAELLLDREGFLHEKYGVRQPFLYVIRPDWYIGFRGRGDASEKLLAYLERNLLPGIS